MGRWSPLPAVARGASTRRSGSRLRPAEGRGFSATYRTCRAACLASATGTARGTRCQAIPAATLPLRRRPLSIRASRRRALSAERANAMTCRWSGMSTAASASGVRRSRDQMARATARWTTCRPRAVLATMWNKLDVTAVPTHEPCRTASRSLASSRGGGRRRRATSPPGRACSCSRRRGAWHASWRRPRSHAYAHDRLLLRGTREAPCHLPGGEVMCPFPDARGARRGR